MINQKAKKFWNPSLFEKGGKTTASRVSIYLCCYDQILWMLKFRYKKYAENSNRTNKFQRTGKGLKSSRSHLFWEKWERGIDYNKKSFTLSVLLWPSFMDAEFQIQKVCRKFQPNQSIPTNGWLIKSSGTRLFWENWERGKDYSE